MGTHLSKTVMLGIVCVAVVTLAALCSGPSHEFPSGAGGGNAALDPADIALARSDLPGWDIRREGYENMAELLANYLDWGFENSYKVEFRKENLQLLCRVERFSTASGAREAFDFWRSNMESWSYYGMGVLVEHQKIGDLSFVWEKLSPIDNTFEGYTGMFQKSNFVIMVASQNDYGGEISLQDIVGYMRVCERRVD